VAIGRTIEAAATAFGLSADSVESLELLGNLVREAPLALTSSRDRGAALGAHVADSLSALALPVVRDADSLADVGSGGGFPGLVLAVALPDAHVTLIESVGKKAAFLEQAAQRLGLANGVVAGLRVEEWAAGHGTQAVVTARAVAPLAVLVEYAAPLLRIGGALVAWKGPAAAAELPDSSAAADLLGMSAPTPATQDSQFATDQRTLYVSFKVRSTPSGYPRAPGKARKRPITA
jgi:16S rRNA (guanine527-N7)-methyltransferase